MPWPSTPAKSWKKKEDCSTWSSPGQTRFMGDLRQYTLSLGPLVQNEPSRFIERYHRLPGPQLRRGGARNQGSSGNERSATDRMHGGSFGQPNLGSRKRYGPPPAKKETKPRMFLLKPYMKTIEHNPSPDFVPSDTSALQVGQKVEHQKFGFGEVVGIEGSTHNPIATVKFQYNGERRSC